MISDRRLAKQLRKRLYSEAPSYKLAPIEHLAWIIREVRRIDKEEGKP